MYVDMNCQQICKISWWKYSKKF